MLEVINLAATNYTRQKGSTFAKKEKKASAKGRRTKRSFHSGYGTVDTIWAILSISQDVAHSDFFFDNGSSGLQASIVS